MQMVTETVTHHVKRNQDQHQDAADDGKRLGPPGHAGRPPRVPAPFARPANAHNPFFSIHRVSVNTQCLHQWATFGGMPKIWTETVESHRDAVREAALEAAELLLAKHGLRGVTMSLVAEKAGIGRATLYKYFPDIEALLTAWHARQIDRHLQQLEKIAHGSGNAGERLEAVLEEYALIQHNVGLAHDSAALVSQLHRGEHVGHAHNRLRDFIKELISQAAVDGQLRSDVAAGELADYCIHALSGARALPSKPAVRRLVKVTLGGLSAK